MCVFVCDPPFQTPVLTASSARHSSVLMHRSNTLNEKTAPKVDLADSTDVMALLGLAAKDSSGGLPQAPSSSAVPRKGAISEWRKSSMQVSLKSAIFVWFLIVFPKSTASASSTSLLVATKEASMEGWLYKQSSRDPTVWKRRYLVLKRGKTVYSREERGSDAEIPMDVVGSVRMAPEAHALAFCIDAVTRTFVLRAETRDELNAWVFAYHKAALLVLDLLTEPGHVPRESRLRLQKWWKVCWQLCFRLFCVLIRGLVFVLLAKGAQQSGWWGRGCHADRVGD